MSAADHPRALEAALDLAMPTAVQSSSDIAVEDRAPPGRKRLKIWEIPSGWLCSMVGTCLMPGDVDRIVRRSRLRFQDGTEDYEIHGFMVARASEQGRVGREINKILDDKYAAIVRKVADEDDQERLAAVWDELCGRGLVAGAYWAIMSHAHVADELKVHAFGEVHMLLHFMGGYNRHSAKELWMAERKVQRLNDRLDALLGVLTEVAPPRPLSAPGWRVQLLPPSAARRRLRVAVSCMSAGAASCCRICG